MKQNSNNAHSKKLSEINQIIIDLIVSFTNEFNLFVYDSYLVDFKDKIKDLDTKQKKKLITYYQKTLNDFTLIQQNLSLSLSKTQSRIKQIDQKFVENLNSLSQLLKIYTENTRSVYKDIITNYPNNKELYTKIKNLDKNLVNYHSDTKSIFISIKSIHRKDNSKQMKNENSKSTDNIYNIPKTNSLSTKKTQITRQKSVGIININHKRKVISSHKSLCENKICLDNEHVNKNTKKMHSLDIINNIKSHSSSFYQGITTDYNSNITQSDLDNSRKNHILSLSQSTPLLINNTNTNAHIDISNITIVTLSELFIEFITQMKTLQDTISSNNKTKDKNDPKGRFIINELKKTFERKKMHLINIANNIISSNDNNNNNNVQIEQNKNKEQIIKLEQEILSLKEELLQKKNKLNEKIIQLSNETNTLKEQNESLTAQNIEMKTHIQNLEQENKKIKIELQKSQNIIQTNNKEKNVFIIEKMNEGTIYNLLSKEKNSNESTVKLGMNVNLNQHNMNELTFSEIINSTLQNNTNGTLDIKTDEEAEINVISGTGNAAINLLEDSVNDETI